VHSMLSLEGKQLGNYDIIRRIRVGGMGAVYEGRQRTAFDRRVAIKVILGNFANDREMRRRFAREARTVARLHHPHILPLIEFGDERGILYLVMPYIDGGTLTSYLHRSLPDLAEVAAIYQQILDAVEFAHDEGLIHRDIKSSNVLLELRRSGAPYAYLGDFGLVRTMRQTEPDMVGKLIPLDQVPGTPHYMAPEQTRGIITSLTDIYALGVLLYQMLTGELPYNDEDEIRVIQMHLSSPIPAPSAHDASIPRELDEVVRKAMAKRPENRYQNVTELRQAFLAALQGPGIALADEENLSDSGEILAQPATRRPASVPLAHLDLPEPVILPRRVDPIIVPQQETARANQRQDADIARPMRRAARPAQRTTDTVRQRPRITEDPFSRMSVLRRRPPTNILAISIAVPLLLLILLIMPRAIGFSLFPVGFPLFGVSPIATIYVTAQSSEVKGNYVLTASPKITKPDLTTQVVPAHVLQSTASGSSTVPTSGGTTVDGQRAQGTVTFTNSNNVAVMLPQTVLTTPSGVRFQVVNSITVPARKRGQNGSLDTPVVAIDPGVAGNVPAHALDSTCCTDGVSVSNDEAFTGGIDGKVTHSVAQADLDQVRNKLVPGLEQNALQQLQKQLGPDDAFAGKPLYQIAVTPSAPVGAQATTVQVRISVSATGTIYARSIVTSTASQLLGRQAQQSLGKQYQLSGPTSVGTPAVQQSQSGNVYLNVSARGFWFYNITNDEINKWPISIKGSSTAAALAYLNGQPGVHSVEIHLPFGTDTLPTDIDNIKIQLINP